MIKDIENYLFSLTLSSIAIDKADILIKRAKDLPYGDELKIASKGLERIAKELSDRGY